MKKESNREIKIKRKKDKNSASLRLRFFDDIYRIKYFDFDQLVLSEGSQRATVKYIDRFEDGSLGLTFYMENYGLIIEERDFLFIGFMNRSPNNIHTKYKRCFFRPWKRKKMETVLNMFSIKCVYGKNEISLIFGLSDSTSNDIMKFFTNNFADKLINSKLMYGPPNLLDSSYRDYLKEQIK